MQHWRSKVTPAEYQVIVIGAGPAGATTARYAALGGCRVCLIDRRADVGEFVRCGEGVGLKGMSISIGVKPQWIKSTIRQVKIVSSDGTTVTLRNVAESYVLDREIMDRALVDDASLAGASTVLSTSIISVRMTDDSRYECVAADGRVFIGQCLVLADGVESRLARQLGWKNALLPADIETCAFARVETKSIEDDTCYFYTGSNYAPGGYLWVFPRGAGFANVGLGVLGSFHSAGKAHELLGRFIAEKFPGATVTHRHCGGVPVGKWTNPLVKNGAIIVGDAARQVNCLNGGGLAYGIFAAKAAGTVIGEAFAGGTFNSGHLKKYQKIWAKKMGKQQLRSHTVKEILTQIRNDTFENKLAAMLSKKDPSKLGYLQVFLATAFKRPLLIPKIIKLFT